MSLTLAFNPCLPFCLSFYFLLHEYAPKTSTIKVLAYWWLSVWRTYERHGILHTEVYTKAYISEDTLGSMDIVGLLEILVLRPYPDLLNEKPRVGPGYCLNKHSRWLLATSRVRTTELKRCAYFTLVKYSHTLSSPLFSVCAEFSDLGWLTYLQIQALCLPPWYDGVKV